MASATCRRPVPTDAMENNALTESELVVALYELCSMGLIEQLNDHGVARYRPLGREEELAA